MENNSIMTKERKFPWQQCQNEELNEKFKELHREIVDRIVLFCKENGVEFDNVYLTADGVRFSVQYGEWTAATDSSFSAYCWTPEHPYKNGLEGCEPFLWNI